MAQRHNKHHVSTNAFEALGLSSTALGAVADLGYSEPTPVQSQAIPLVLEGRDLMASAQTGTGKTAAFLLPALDHLDHARHGQGPHMLVVTPTRELAQQIEDVASVVCKRTRHVPVVVVGGVSYEPQKDALRSGCDLLVATPGRLIDLINQGACNLSGVQVLVLDEADRMLDMGFLPDMRKIVAQTPDTRQTLLFSATLSDDVLEHTSSLVHDPARVEIAHKGTAAETIRQYVLGVSPEAKKGLLAQILRNEGTRRVIVFTNGKHRADAFCKRLRKEGISCAPIHGNRSQNQRASALHRFDTGEIDVLVATDVLARGIDIPDVSYVINVDVPHEAEDYIHRIGRTGRAGESGWALTLVTQDDYLYLRDIEQLMGITIPTYDHADGLDLGKDVPTLDPSRDPHDKLPSKKARKAMERKRREARQTPSDDRTEGQPQSQKARTDRPKAKAKAKKTQPEKHKQKSTTPRADRNAPASDRPRKKAKKRSQRRYEETEPDSVWSNGKAGKSSKGQSDHKRHPGDHGGKRRR